MADGVRHTYKKHLDEAASLLAEMRHGYDEAWCKEYALKKTRRETYQAMEGLVHNLNTLNSRAGAQVKGCLARW